MSGNLLKTVLLIEDNLGDARLLREMLNEEQVYDIDLVHVQRLSEAEAHLAKHAVDVILLDLGLPDAQGRGAIRRVGAFAPRIPLVVLTRTEDDALAALALQDGVQDYHIKGQIATRALLRSLRYAIERKRLESLKDEFVSTVSHELRTPLTSISGSLGLLMSDAAGKLPRPAMRLVGIAHTNCQRLVRLVNDILDIERVQSGGPLFEFKQVALRPLIEDVIEANRGFAEGYGVKIKLAACATDADARVDPDRLTQAITNLLSNAIRFSPPGQEVTVSIEKAVGSVWISVRDHGPGIPDDFKPRIFERFAQADATDTRQKGGTGLGLSIVKQVVERLGGEVGFGDAPGGGAIFYIALPFLPPAAGHCNARSSHDSSGESRQL
jgi:signal transduction histidine kinase